MVLHSSISCDVGLAAQVLGRSSHSGKSHRSDGFCRRGRLGSSLARSICSPNLIRIANAGPSHNFHSTPAMTPGKQLTPWLVFLLLFVLIAAQADTTCSVTRPCFQGCCIKDGHCGFGPDFCGDGCQGNCNKKAECGKYAPPGQEECPLLVCCSQFGYCGTTGDFCNAKCQSNCEQPT